jgi:hypothetical protein
MAKLGTIPKRLAKCAVPTCSACLYAKAIQKPWRSRTSTNIDKARKLKRHGECVSVDQLVSPTPGLITQMSGFLTMKRYKYATVYVDQASQLSFVWLQKTAIAEETLEGKTAFEQYVKDRGITVQAYHADNGIFRATKWVMACRTLGQSLSFAGVNAHHQNGIAERCIWTLQELARTMLIHANHRWPNGDNKSYVLKVHRNIYGKKQAGRVWNKYLVNKLTEEIGFVQSEVDKCVFYRGKTMYALYTDESIIAGPDKNEIDDIISNMKKVKLNITEEGELEDFLGVDIEQMPDGTIHLTQPHQIDQILDNLQLNNKNVTAKNVPALSTKILSRHSESEKFDGSFNYKSVIGKLNYLEKSTRSDISYINHQCARFAIDPKIEQVQALKHLRRYLKATQKMGTILKPIKGQDLEVYVDANFCGNWDPKETWDVNTARSRHGFVISYAGCPVMWKSQLQTKIALWSTESKYCGLSYALRDVIPIMELLKEMKRFKFSIKTADAKVHCKVFEDKS